MIEEVSDDDIGVQISKSLGDPVGYSKMTDEELQKERNKQISIMDLACATDKPDDCRMTKTFVDNLMIIDAQLMHRYENKIEELERRLK